jgi:hypothetical protein
MQTDLEVPDLYPNSADKQSCEHEGTNCMKAKKTENFKQIPWILWNM